MQRLNPLLPHLIVELMAQKTGEVMMMIMKDNEGLERKSEQRLWGGEAAQ